jgi:hypothetical protein
VIKANIKQVGVAECRDELPIATLVAEAVGKTPLPENHPHNQHRRKFTTPSHHR